MFDFDRSRRTGLDEVVLCEGKTVEQLVEIFTEVTANATSFLLTRLDPCKFRALPANLTSVIDYDEVSRTGIVGAPRVAKHGRNVAVVTGGSSDVPVAREAVRTLGYFGFSSREVHDVGVAGLWRLLDRVEELRAYPCVIVIAGMDGALPTVVAGLVPGMVVAVPTSTGYGTARGGETALAALLTSCAPGLAVVNIDNGFGAACVALRCLNLIEAEARIAQKGICLNAI